MELPATVFVAGGAIIASLITGLITFTNILISKDQKTSEFRQDWIDRVRGEVSLFTSSVADFTSHLVAKKGNKEALDKFFDDNIKLTGEITRSYNSLRLHLNKVDDKKIVDTLGELYEFAAKDEIDFEVEDVAKKENELISLTQVMLKKEWTRVKAGEKTYQIMKWLGLFMIIAPVLVIGMNYKYIATFWAT